MARLLEHLFVAGISRETIWGKGQGVGSNVLLSASCQ